MTRPEALQALLTRVEAATGANFELECAIFEALSLPTEWFGSKVTGHFRIGSRYGFNTEDGYRHLDCVRAPPVTASLDAALALVERVLPGRNVDLLICPEFSAATIRPQRFGDDEPDSVRRPTPALALLAALLKVLIANADTPSTPHGRRDQ